MAKERKQGGTRAATPTDFSQPTTNESMGEGELSNAQAARGAWKSPSPDVDLSSSNEEAADQGPSRGERFETDTRAWDAEALAEDVEHGGVLREAREDIEHGVGATPEDIERGSGASRARYEDVERSQPASDPTEDRE